MATFYIFYFHRFGGNLLFDFRLRKEIVMGMYNEVFKKCPTCNGYGEMHISQIVLGFGGFYLDNPERIAEELDEDQVIRLKNAVEDSKWFFCKTCDKGFSIESPEKTKSKIDIINSIGKHDDIS
jgi:hypothetical protein